MFQEGKATLLSRMFQEEQDIQRHLGEIFSQNWPKQERIHPYTVKLTQVVDLGRR